jgi:broad specificity phosphatase PhoE
MYPCQVILVLFFAFFAVIPVTFCFSLQQRQPSFFSKFGHFSRLTALRMKRETVSDKDSKTPKRLILIRHGCTFMNEYLATPGSRWGDANFTDIFHTSDEHSLYMDSPLSNEGTKQAQELRDYFQSTEKGKGMICDIELIAVSPLQRTLQTAEIAVLPHVEDTNRDIPIVALPLASERVYLISDHGSCKQSLSVKFPFVDFAQEFDRFGDNWWFSVHEQAAIKTESSLIQETHSFASMHIDDYKEWRPSDENQTYSCHGEPDDAFEERMLELYKWLEARNESVICLVCHWGVLDWLTGGDFRNCEVRDISFDDVRERVALSKATATQT